jgi:two-component system nitrogen regulation sensor histidine kinase NtrY
LTTPNPSPASRGALPAAERRRRRRDWLIAALIGSLLTALVLLQPQLLVSSRTLPVGSDAIFLALLYANVLLIGLLVFLLARNVVKLVVERRRGIFGARLNTRFVLAFLFVTVVSSTSLFVLSWLLVTRAINLWFELELGDSLEQSVALAEDYYATQEDSALFFARRMAEQIASERLLNGDRVDALQAFVETHQAEYDLGGVQVFSAQHEELASATHPERTVVSLESAESQLIAGGLEGVERTRVSGAARGELVRAVVPVYSTFKDRDVVGVVVVNRFIPYAIGARAAAVQASVEAYRRLQPREGAFQSSMGTLLAMLWLVSALFAAWIGFRMAKQISEPIQRLAGAATQVAAGNLDVQVERVGDDEIGMLVSEFNRMATDLRSSREALEARRAQMEIILRSVAAGVLSLDRDGVIQTINPSALRLLGIGWGEWAAKKVDEVLEGEALATLRDLLRRLSSGPQQTLRRQGQVLADEELRTLNWTASRIHDAEGEATGFVVVLDDVTQILKVQRMAAWREVARRIAHEIKNPLTPIQLSAQRLRRRLGGQLTDPGARRLLEESTGAITAEVEALKNLLAEFSNFARLPATDPAPTDLNRLVSEVAELYRGNTTIELQIALAPDVPTLDLDREQMKRVILNLVDNAIAAIDAAGGGPRIVRVSTRFQREVPSVALEVADTGTGVTPEDRVRLFEPYFSTKRQGSGLGLAIVSRIVSDHSGYVRVRDNRPRGTRFIVELPART